MKKLLFVLSLLICLCLRGDAVASDLNWDASTGDVTGYTVYYGLESGTFVYNFGVGNVTSLPNMEAVLQLQPGQAYFFVVRAYNAVGESGNSNEVTLTIPPIYAPPVNVLPVALPMPEPPANTSVL